LGLILLSLLPRGYTQLQKPKLHFKHIQNEDGLANSTIEAIHQDQRGFIWLGTRDGLNRYDGHQMTVYKYTPKYPYSLSDSYVTCIYEDRQHQLWVGTLNGLNLYDPRLNRFTRFQHINRQENSLSHNYVTAMLEDHKGNFWVTTLGGGINVMDRKTGAFRSYHQNDGLSSAETFCVFEDINAKMWVGTAKGLHLFDQITKRFRNVLLPQNLRGGAQLAIRNIAGLKNGHLLLGSSDNGLIVYDPRSGVCRQYVHSEADPFSISSNLIRSILVSKNGQIWVGSINGGLDRFDSATGRFYNYQNEPDNPQSLSQRTVSALYEDNQGNLWIGTHRGGVNLYMPKTEKFELYRQEPRPNSLSYNDVKTFAEDRYGYIWIGTDGGGLNRFERKTRSFKHYRHQAFDPRTIGSNEVLDVFEDRQGQLWVGSWGGGLCLYERSREQFTRFQNRPGDFRSISSNYIQKIFEDRKGNFWVATYFGGLNRFDRQNRTFRRITKSESGKTQLLGNNIVSINEDLSGNLWIGTDDGGLNCLNASTGEFSHYFHQDEKKPDLRVLFVDKKGQLWLGQAGLFRFDPLQNQFKLLTEKAGLATEFIKGIAEDETGNLWIATSNGLTKIHPKTLRYRKFNTADGLQGLEFEANAYLKTKDGQLFFGGVNGFNTFYPQNIATNEYLPPVYLTDFHIYNEKVWPGDKNSPLSQDISLSDKIVLSYKQATFSFDFAALNYTAAENNQYAYMLENWDQGWNEVGTEKRASYTNVSPGEYTFRVKASNNDGVWNKTGRSLKVIILPPFWATWWFRALLVLSIGAGLYWFYRFRRDMELQRLEEQKREELHQLQLQFFTNITHEFRTPLSLILGPIEKLLKEETRLSQRKDYQVIQRNTNRLLHLVNELMDFRKSEAGILRLHVMEGNIAWFLQEIAEEFSALAQEKGIDFVVNPRLVGTGFWFDRQILEKILINLISNAFKYTHVGGQIVLEIVENLDNFKPSFANELTLKSDYKAQRYLYFRVLDNGIGISKESIGHLFERYYRISDAHLGSGIGLAFVKSLTALHKGLILVSSERHQGTEIVIGIPCTREDYGSNELWLDGQDSPATLESFQAHYDYFMPLGEEKPEQEAENHLSFLPSFHILVVDDNEELRTFLREVLASRYQVSEAQDGQEAYTKALAEQPDLIISDIMMPVMDGIEFCKKVKSDPQLAHIPFVLLTAKEALESKIEGTSSGADYYFAKPISIELLELNIKNIFAQKQKLVDRYVQDHHAEVKDQVHSSKDKQFLENLIALIENNLLNPELNIDYLCTQMGMSRTKLYNKLKGMTNQSINDFVRSVRLKNAVKLMVNQDVSLAEVMYNVGIQTQSYFTKAFKAEYGKTPSQFLKELQGRG
jgi:ligand-binding sensor domain-containing protein/signal transduction histidine kinase/CheY-like chemotaxis protein